MRPERRRAEVIRFARHYHRCPVRVGQPDRMTAADLRDPLADAKFSVVAEAAGVFARDVAVSFYVDVAHLNLFEVIGQQLQTVRIDAAQVGGHERSGHQASLGRAIR